MSGFVHFSMAAFTPQEHAPGCSRPPEETGFGLAGGGYGAYGACPECGAILWKTPEDDEPEDDGQPDESQEWADFDRDC
jgi:hypothetical protein